MRYTLWQTEPLQLKARLLPRHHYTTQGHHSLPRKLHVDRFTAGPHTLELQASLTYTMENALLTAPTQKQPVAPCLLACDTYAPSCTALPTYSSPASSMSLAPPFLCYVNVQTTLPRLTWPLHYGHVSIARTLWPCQNNQASASLVAGDTPCTVRLPKLQYHGVLCPLHVYALH
jgi:hypothetical protein